MDGHLGDRISALLDAELGPDEEAAVQAHLASCEACRSELEAIAAARTWVRALPAVDPPFGFYERMLLRKPHDLPKRSRRRFQAGLAAAAATAAAGLIVVGVASPKDDSVTVPVEQLVAAHASAGATADPVSQLVPVGAPVTLGRE